MYRKSSKLGILKLPIPCIHKTDGFTIIEVIIAVFLLAVGVLSLLKLQAAGIWCNAVSNKFTIASTIAQDTLEELMLLDYNDATLADSNTANNPPSADFESTNTAGGKTDNHTKTVTIGNHPFDIYWNVADDNPVDETKTMAVIITWVDSTNHKIVVRSTRD